MHDDGAYTNLSPTMINTEVERIVALCFILINNQLLHALAPGRTYNVVAPGPGTAKKQVPRRVLVFVSHVSACFIKN